MKRLLLALILCMASVLAFAAPSPKAIESALAARDYSSAKTMISQVLAEHPDSARAHLLKAYVLAASDKNKEAAKAELAIAKTLDKKGDVVNSPLFGRTVAAIDNIQVAPPAPTYVQSKPAAPTYVAPAPAPMKQEGSSTGFWIFMSLLLAGGVGCAVYFFSRRKPDPDGFTPYSASPSPAPTPEYRSAAPTYSRPSSQYRPRPTPAPEPYRGGMSDSYGTSGSGMSTGAAVATGAVAGVAGAIVVDSMIENARLKERLADRDRHYGSGSSNSWSPSPAPYVPPAPAPSYDTPQVDYESERQSFSSSSSKNDSWGSSSDEEESKKSSSSSSSDWGSSSSSSDSYSSSDSSSSSSSSDSSGW